MQNMYRVMQNFLYMIYSFVHVGQVVSFFRFFHKINNICLLKFTLAISGHVEMHLHKFFHMWSHISHVITNIWSHVCDVCDFFLQWISVQTWSMVLCGFHLNLSLHNYLNRHSILSFFCTYYPRRHILPGCRPRLFELERGNLFSSMSMNLNSWNSVFTFFEQVCLQSRMMWLPRTLQSRKLWISWRT